MSEQATSTSSRSMDDQRPEYGESYFLNYWGGEGPYERNERWLGFFDGVAEGIVRDFHPTTVLDVGCAMGFLVEALRNRGVEASGIDVSEYAISKAHESVADHCRVASLTEPLAGRYDLLTCIEVLEHIPPAESDRAIANLCAATDRLIISSTPGDFGEPTHLNVQPPEAWSARLAQEGFLRDLDHDLSYISPWAACYVRLDETPADTVRRYDRAWWRLRSEVAEVRKSLLESRERLARLESTAGIESRTGLREEVDRHREEILRLRDLLVGKDVELGAAKGRLAEIEDRSERISIATSRIESRVPVLGKLIGTAIRRLRGQRG